MADQNVGLNFSLSGQDGVSAVVLGARDSFSALAKEAAKGATDSAAAQAKYRESLGNTALAAKVAATAERDLAAATALAAQKAENAARAGNLQAAGATKAEAMRAVSAANREATAETAKMAVASVGASAGDASRAEALRRVTAGIRAHNGAIADAVASLTGLGHVSQAATSTILNFLHSGLMLGVIGSIAFAGAILAVGAHIRQVRAELKLLGDSDTKKLADDLNLSQKAAIGLQHAITDLSEKGRLLPTTALLAQIARNAKAIGEDGEKAVAEYTIALAKGGDALEAFERKNGRLAMSFGSMLEAAGKFNVDAKLSDIGEKTLTTQEKVKAVLVEQNTAANLLVIAEQNRDAYARAALHNTTAANEQAAGESRQRADDAQRVVDRLAAQQAKLQEQLRTERDIASWAKVYADRLADVNDQIAEAAGELKTQHSIDQKITLELEKQELIRRRIAVLSILEGAVSKEILDTERKKLQQLQTATQRDVNTDFREKESMADAARAKRSAAGDKAAALRAQQIEYLAKIEDSAFKARIAAVPAEQAAEKARLEALYVEFDTVNKMDKARSDAAKLHVSSISAVANLELERANRLTALDNAEIVRKKKLSDDQKAFAEAAEKSIAGSAIGGATGGESAILKLKLVEIERENALGAARKRASDLGISAERALLAVNMDADAKRDKIAKDEKKRSDESEKAELDKNINTAAAGVGALKQLDIGKRASAALDAALEIARAYASYPDPAGMISHGAAAVAFGAVALGFSGSAPSPSGGASPASAQSPSSSGSNAPKITVIQYGFGTLQQMARGVHEAVGSAKNTGYASGTV